MKKSTTARSVKSADTKTADKALPVDVCESLEALGIDHAKAMDNEVSPWDAMTRPEGPIEAYTEHQLWCECVNLAAVFLTRKGWLVKKVGYAGRNGSVDLVCEEPEREDSTVLVKVRPGIDLNRPTACIPEMHVTRAERKRLRSVLLDHLWERPELESARVDVLAVNLIGQREAKLRHLMGAVWADVR